MRAVLVLLGLLLLAACGDSAESAGGGSACPEPAADQGVVRRDTRHGQAALELVLEPKTIAVGERVTIRLFNRGETELLTGYAFEVERWEETRWVRVPWPKNTGFRLLGIGLRPGASTDPQHWPIEGIRVSPGCYRAVKGAGVLDRERIAPPDPLYGRLEAFAHFRVRPAG
jgi:hypothetical protein